MKSRFDHKNRVLLPRIIDFLYNIGNHPKVCRFKLLWNMAMCARVLHDKVLPLAAKLQDAETA